ncbi:glycoside hydrolase family 9 protein [Sphingomonas endophytica]|uniref:Endoglucanase n=1 Tax=Sphingomonas endophytica TaxID=869719 RepID=A0A147HZU8_9SPHN|nr:glycoside hydrolase family 9 protein [Sphingomonas endophytica]KTT70548.1 glycosyl hydrolase [Sphingomonas endophytica]
MKALFAAATALWLVTASAQAEEPPPVAIRLDQIGFAPASAKIAVLADGGERARSWTLIDHAGTVRLRGKTRPFGRDASSGERIQVIDFSSFTVPGDGYRLTAGGATSHPFRIAPLPFADVTRAAMSFFYQQRSGVPIRADLVERPDLARAAGHPAERVTCFAGRDTRGVAWPGCDYRLDVTGGWYDAGDHGKYVVNGGISAWTLLDLHQRLTDWGRRDLFADGTLSLPERGNGIDDLLDEARVEIEFLMAMQVPEGRRLRVARDAGGRAPATRFEEIDAGGLVHAKVADERWTGLPMAPADDPMPRFLYPPTTAATLNMVAVAAQAARVWRTIDPAFAARALAAARRGWAAAERYPALLASSDFAGSGGYGDGDLADERFWAAAELLATTGEASFAAVVARSPLLDSPAGDLSWGRTDIAGVMTLANGTTAVPLAIRDRARVTLTHRADALLAERRTSGYRLPLTGAAFGWGSNSTLLNRAMILGGAWQFAHRPALRDAVVDVMDYLLGRNALDRSYVTGFGARTVRQPHHRFWAHAADARYPVPPAGVVSGGPNATAMTDPVAARMKGTCVGQTCWVDDWRAFTMNEVAINWNAPLVWVSAFLTATEPR